MMKTRKKEESIKVLAHGTHSDLVIVERGSIFIKLPYNTFYCVY